MTIASTLNRTSLNGNGVTKTIPISFPFHNAVDLVVLSVVIATGVQTTLALTTHYTITGTPDGLGHYSSGGAVVMVSAPAGTVRIVVYRDPARTQSLDLVENDNLPAESVEAQFDYAVMLIQRVADLIGRSLRQPDGDSSDITAMPTVADRASKFLGFDASGNPLAASSISASVPVSAFAATVLDDTTAAAARTTLGVNDPGTVRLLGNGGGTWALYNRDGSSISIAGSTTNGLQEAITYAFANGALLIVTGGGTITCTTAITIPAGFMDCLYIENGITIAFGTLGAANLITINSQENCHITIKAVITQTAGNTGAVIAIKPTSAAPTTGNTTIAASVFEFGDLVPASTGIGLLIDIGTAGCLGCTLFVADINGGVDGIRVTNPGSGLIVFEENRLSWAYIHGQSGRSIRIGTTTTNQSNLRKNLYSCGRLAPSGASSIGIESWEQYGTYINPSASNEEGTLDKGMVFGAGSVNNTLIGGTILGATTNTIENNGAGLVVIAGGIAAPMGGSSSSTPVVGKATAQLTQVATAANTVETTLQTYSLPANAFNNNGISVRIKAWGSFAANANNKTVKLYFGAVSFVNSGAVAGNNVKWIIEGTVHRVGATSQKCNGHFIYGTTEVGVQNNAATETDTAAIVIKVTGQNGSSSASDIVCEGMIVDFGN